MAKLSADELELGMILSKPVTTAHGGLLMKPGTEITEDHLRLLKMWGINDVHVESPEDEQQKQNIDAEVQKAQAKIDAMFDGLDNDPIMKIIRNMAKKQVQSDIEEQIDG